MNRAHSVTIFLLLALFGCHQCQDAAPNASTAAPAPTSPGPNSTSTTTTAPPKTTTPAPKTTTTTPVPTTPSPTPAPTTLNGNITENDRTCLRYEFTVQFHIKYNTTKKEIKEVIVPLPLNAQGPIAAPNTCNASKEAFVLKTDNIAFELSFGSNENSFFLDSIILNVTFDNKTFPDFDPSLNKTQTFNLTGLNGFNVEKTHSYFCANVTIPKSEDGQVKITFGNLKLQAFMDKSQKGQFSSEHNCQNEINDVVPIAVGAALTGLVVIVMIAYFIGRRRSRRLAYQSV